MPSRKIQYIERFVRFWRDIKIPPAERPLLYFNIAGWLITFYFLFIAIQTDTNWKSVWVIFTAIFWVRLNKNILKNIDPPVELILLSLLCFYSIEFSYLNARLNALSINGLDPVSDILLAILIFHLGLILIINSPANRINILEPRHKKQNYNQFGLIGYAFLWFILHLLIYYKVFEYLFVFQIILFFILLNKCSWLERLSRYELWLNLGLALIVFLLLSEPSGFAVARYVDAKQYTTWYSLPLYVHYLTKIYFLALVVKIPVVMIYNHAGLERKLKIASLFQSSFPLLIQFIFLIIIFFYFISGWQAGILRKTLYEYLAKPELTRQLSTDDVPLIGTSSTLLYQDYEPKNLTGPIPQTGILCLNRITPPAQGTFSNQDYFLFQNNQQYLRLIKLDTTFARIVYSDLTLLAGSGLLFYPFLPNEWQRYIYNAEYFQDDNQVGIYPFSIFAQDHSWRIASPQHESRFEIGGIRFSGFEFIVSDRLFVVGRVFLPVIGEEFGDLPYFAFDVYFRFDTLFLQSLNAKILLILAVLFLLVNMLVIGRLSKFGGEINTIIVQKFAVLKHGIRQIASGNLDFKLKMGGEDEFVELAGHFNEMSDKLKKTIAEAREKDRLDHELKIARQVQLGLLPVKLPEIPGYRIASSITTANEIGGDFYDILPLDKDTFLFTIGDVSGKGSSAAFYMAQFISLLRFSPQFTVKPHEIAQRLNTYFSRQVTDRQIFVTSVIGILDIKKHSVKFVRTGHMPPILIPGNSKKDIIDVSTEGLGIGLTKTQHKFTNTLKEKSLKLQPGDTLILYTDGVTEAASDINGASEHKTEILGEQRLRAILQKYRGAPAEQIDRAINDMLRDFYHDQAPVDDYTLFIIQRKAGVK